MPFEANVEILIYVFITLAMLCIGMTVTLSEMTGLLRNRVRTGKVLLANLVFVPAIALLLVWVLPVEGAAASVLLLLGFAPGGINAVQFSTKASGQTAAAGEQLFLLTLLSLIIAPVAAGFILPDNAAISVPLGQLVFRAAVLVAAPMVLGALIRRHAPPVAERLYKPAMLVSTLAFIASVILSLSLRQDALAALGGATILAMILFVLLAMAAGWTMGGPSRAEKQVLAVTTNLRNVGLVYVIADGCCGNSGYTAAVLAFMALMVPMNLVMTIASGILRKRR